MLLSGTSFKIIQENSLNGFKEGKDQIDGDRLFALALTTKGKGRQDAGLESHRRYIDFQYTIEGSDFIGYEIKSACISGENGHDSESDIEFYANSPTV